MANYKAERRVKRKERRKAAARQDHREKEEKRSKELKEQNKNKPKKQTAWKRKDKHGNIVLWNAIKITKTSGYILGAMATIIILFAISPIFEDPNYVEPERMSFAECEAINFNDSWCILDYKHCREYADGGKICEYAEENPWVNYDRDENRWTPEEQDFLPPTSDTSVTAEGSSSAQGDFDIDLSDEEWDRILEKVQGNFILPLAYGTHDHLSGFAEHDIFINKEQQSEPTTDILDETGLNIINDKLPSTPEALTIFIEELKIDIERTEDELIKTEREIQEWRVDEQKLSNERFTAENELEDAEEELEEAKRKYRHAQDMIIRDNEDIREQDAVYDDYKIKVRVHDQEKKTFFR